MAATIKTKGTMIVLADPVVALPEVVLEEPVVGLAVVAPVVVAPVVVAPVVVAPVVVAPVVVAPVDVAVGPVDAEVVDEVAVDPVAPAAEAPELVDVPPLMVLMVYDRVCVVSEFAMEKKYLPPEYESPKLNKIPAGNNSVSNRMKPGPPVPEGIESK